MFIYIFWLLAAICGGLGTGVFFVFSRDEIKPLVILAAVGIAIGVFAAIFVFSIVFFFIKLGLVSLCFNKNKEFKTAPKWFFIIYNCWCRYFLMLFGVRIKIKGLEKIPVDKKCMIVCNHRSNFDPFINTCVFRKTPIALISKKEAFNIPFIGRMMKRALYLSMDREDIRSSLMTIMKAIDYIRTDLINVCVFPEGTRSKTNKLLDFKPGCFKIAETTQCPIVVGVMKGTEKIKDNFPWHSTTVTYEILTVIQSEEYKTKTNVELSDSIHEIMKNSLEASE